MRGSRVTRRAQFAVRIDAAGALLLFTLRRAHLGCLRLWRQQTIRQTL